MSLEDTFRSWANPPSETETTKCDNAVTAIKKAIAASSKLSKRDIRVFAQGSYCNRTNVRQNSDVDVCIVCSDSFFFELPNETDASDFSISTPAPYSYSEYKNEVEAALKAYFGSGVTRGKKAFDIHENSYRIDADAIPTFEFRRYSGDGSYLEGVGFVPDDGDLVENWPDQHYSNGVEKNKATGGRFKDVVRILKRLQIEMDEEGIEAAAPIPSFLIESLVWNVPDDNFGYETLTADVRDVLAHLFNNTMKLEDCREWGEVSDLKYLFWSGQPWTWEQAHGFVSAAWDYLGFE